MQIKARRKLPKDVPTISQCELATSCVLTDPGMSQVNANISMIDQYNQKYTVCNLVMSTKEARQIAANLIRMADYADANSELAGSVE